VELRVVYHAIIFHDISSVVATRTSAITEIFSTQLTRMMRLQHHTQHFINYKVCSNECHTKATHALKISIFTSSISRALN
jgi:hypothetical protein